MYSYVALGLHERNDVNIGTLGRVVFVTVKTKLRLMSAAGSTLGIELHCTTAWIYRTQGSMVNILNNPETTILSRYVLLILDHHHKIDCKAGSRSKHREALHLKFF
jgi:hypothetical protein